MRIKLGFPKRQRRGPTGDDSLLKTVASIQPWTEVVGTLKGLDGRSLVISCKSEVELNLGQDELVGIANSLKLKPGDMVAVLRLGDGTWRIRRVEGRNDDARRDGPDG